MVEPQHFSLPLGLPTEVDSEGGGVCVSYWREVCPCPSCYKPFCELEAVLASPGRGGVKDQSVG